MSNFARTCWFLIVVTLAGAVGGCRAPKASDFKPSNIFSMKSTWPFRSKDEPKEGIPLRIVGTWTDTVLSQPGQKPQRGFGGRLMFYGRDEKKPILVDGQLVVYAFNETGREATDNKPTRRYVFPPDQVPLHMSKSEIGASYSFWLPWDEAGGPQTEVSLICRFEPKGGAVVTSEQTRHLLPGSLPAHVATGTGAAPMLPEGVPSRPARETLESLRSRQQTQYGAQPASYEAPAELGSASTTVQSTSLVPERRMGVTSIRLPDNFQFGGGTVQAHVPSAAATSAQSGAPVIQRSTTIPTTAAPTATVPASTAWPGPASHVQRTAGTQQLARPQFITPQFMSVQPAAPTTSQPTTFTPAAVPAAVRQPAVR